MTFRRFGAVAAAVSLSALTVSGCGQEAICGSKEYPVVQTGGSGRACVAKGQNPPTGFSRFPAGQEPQHVDDKWDKFWRTHTVDATGKTIAR